MNKSKEFRFDGVTPMFAAGRVLFPEAGNDWIADLEHELLVFPNGKNDDYVDSVSQYLAYSRKGNVKRGSRSVNSGMRGV
jgi:predicted phage terminase large subunit-like protein